MKRKKNDNHPDKEVEKKKKLAVRKSARERKAKKFEKMISEESFSESSSEESDDSQFDEDDNECGLCGGAFQEGELWLQCDICKKNGSMLIALTKERRGKDIWIR